MSDQWRELGDELEFDPSTRAESHPTEEAHAEDPEQWRELGEEKPAEEQVPVAPRMDDVPDEAPGQWRELGDDEPRPEQPAEETSAADEFAVDAPREEEPPVPEGGVRATEEEGEAQYPTEAAEQELHAEEDANGVQENYPTEGAGAEEEAHPSDEPEPQAENNEEQWRELGDEAQPQAEERQEEQPSEDAAPVEEQMSGFQPAVATRMLIADPPAEEAHATEEDPEQWRELGEEKPAEEQVPVATRMDDVPDEAPGQWRELGDDEPRPEQPAEETSAADEFAVDAPREEEPPVPEGGVRATEEEGEAQYPTEAAEQELHAEEDANGVQENYPTEGAGAEEEAHPSDEPEPQAENNEEQWRELGDEAATDEYPREEAPISAQPFLAICPTAPETANARVVKPNTRNIRQVNRWEPVDYQPSDGSDDEFELSTCVNPIYEEGNDDDAQFKNGTPDCTGEIMSCFDEPNLLYRIINKDGEKPTWYFYNDSLNYEMHVQFTFGKNSKIEPLDDTKMEQNDKGEFVCETVVYPTETEPFITGSVNGFTSKLRAIPLSEEYHNARRTITERAIQEEQEAIKEITTSDNAEEVLQACIANNVPFVDPEFPPCQESLEAGGKRRFKPLAWARPSMYLEPEMAEQVRLFRARPQPGVADPGELGDTWVMCSVSSVSEDPKRLLGMFRHPEGKEAAQREHAVGAYRVTFSKNGWWRSVLVDDYLPVSAGRPKFARSANDPAEIWPSILQKAYAKLHGSYGMICSGDPLHALHDMTGFSTVRFDEVMGGSARGDDNELFDDLVNGVNAGYTIIINTPGKEPKNGAPSSSELTEQYRKVGLLTGHAYTILDAKEFPDHDNLRLVKIRNAWGHGLEWNGDWGDNDAKWDEHPDIAEACNFQKANDGTFWMSWDDCLKYFNGGGICFSHQPVYDYRINSAFYEQVPSCVLEVEVQSPTWMTIVISQEDKRSRKDGGDYQPVMISVAQPTDSGMYKVVLNSAASGIRPSPEKWTFLQARDVSLIHRFDAGKYVIVPRLMPADGQPGEVPYVLGVIANQEIGAGQVSVSFKNLEKGNRVFENFPKFEPELKEPEAEVQYQKRPPGAGFPLTQTGSTILSSD